MTTSGKNEDFICYKSARLQKLIFIYIYIYIAQAVPLILACHQLVFHM